jgi:ribosomal protein S4E
MFINRLIDLTDKNRENWKILMKEIFTIDGKVLWNQIGAKLKENTPKYS